MNRIIYWSLTSALAGFLFGFDTVVISGAEKTIQKLWGLDSTLHGLAVSMALWGTVLGSLVGSWPTDRIGRKKTLLWVGILYFVSAVWSAVATDVYSFMVARFIGGLGVGISTVAAPLYISEIAPPAHRGRLAGMFQFNIVFGILIAFLSNYLIGRFMGDNAWRWMLGAEALPALIYSVMCFGIPESPRWLIGTKGDRDAGIDVLAQVRPESSRADLEATADRIRQGAAVGTGTEGRRFWSRRLRTPILLAFLVAFFNQLSGINAILYFAPRIFGLTGLTEEAALLQSVGIGVTNLVFTFIGLYLIDRLGRRTLLYIGSFGYIISLGLVALAFFTYAPQFKAASGAIALGEAAGKLLQSERAGSGADPAASAILRKEWDDARDALAAAVSDPRYGGSLAIPPDATPQETASVADEVLVAASRASKAGGLIVLVCIFAFIAAHAIGQGAVIWVFISEIFPNRDRAAGQSLGSFTHWIFAATLTLVFPKVVTAFPPGYVFLFFCLMMVLQLVWVRLMVPETKGIPLEEMHRKLGIEG